MPDAQNDLPIVGRKHLIDGGVAKGNGYQIESRLEHVAMVGCKLSLIFAQNYGKNLALQKKITNFAMFFSIIIQI
jgi:hypothetical protein